MIIILDIQDSHHAIIKDKINAPLQDIQREHLRIPTHVLNIAAYVIQTDERNEQFRILKERVDVTNILDLQPIDDNATYSMKQFDFYLQLARTINTCQRLNVEYTN